MTPARSPPRPPHPQPPVLGRASAPTLSPEVRSRRTRTRPPQPLRTRSPRTRPRPCRARPLPRARRPLDRPLPSRHPSRRVEPRRPRHNRRAPGRDLRPLRIGRAARRPDPQLRRRPHRDPPRRPFFLRSVRGGTWAGLAVVLAIFVSACVALSETIQRLHPPARPHPPLALAAAGSSGSPATRSPPRSAARGRRL